MKVHVYLFDAAHWERKGTIYEISNIAWSVNMQMEVIKGLQNKKFVVEQKVNNIMLSICCVDQSAILHGMNL